VASELPPANDAKETEEQKTISKRAGVFVKASDSSHKLGQRIWQLKKVMNQ